MLVFQPEESEECLQAAPLEDSPKEEPSKEEDSALLRLPEELLLGQEPSEPLQAKLEPPAEFKDSEPEPKPQLVSEDKLEDWPKAALLEEPEQLEEQSKPELEESEEPPLEPPSKEEE